MNDMVEVSTIHPDDLRKNTLDASQRAVISVLRRQAYDICRHQIPEEDLRWVFNVFRNGFVYKLHNTYAAFCLWKVLEKKKIGSPEYFSELYVYLICGKQLDTKIVPRIFDDIVHLCRKQNIKYVTLMPLNDKLKTYYMSLGFEERGSDNILELDTSKPRIISNITRSGLSAKTSRRRYKNTRKYRAIQILNNSPTRLENIEEVPQKIF